MKKRYFFILILQIGIQIPLFAQDDGGVSIGKGNNDADNSAILELVSSSKGLLIPRLTSRERETINSPAIGLMVFDTDKNNFYYYANSRWQAFAGTQTSYGTVFPSSGIKEGTLFYNTFEAILYIYISNKWQPAGTLKQTGDMQKSTYDKDENGVVDNAENAHTVNNYTVKTNVPFGAVFTDNQKLSISGNRVSLSSNGGTGSYVDLPATGSGTNAIKGTVNQVIANTDKVSGIVTLSLPDTITGLTSIMATNFRGNATTATTAATAANAAIATNAINAINLSSGTAGAIPYQTETGKTAMLEKGTDGQVLTLKAGVPGWSDNIDSIRSIKGTGFQITATTDTSGIVTLSLPDTIEGVKVIKADKFSGYATNADLAVYAITATTATNFAGGKEGDLPYQTAAGTTTMLSKGTDGQVLTLASGAPTWADATGGTGSSGVSSVTGTTNQITATPTSGAVKLSLPSTITGLSSVTATSFKGTATKATTATTATNLAGGKKGDLPYQTAAGTTTMLSKGTDGQVLTLASGVPTWADATGGTGSSGVSSVTGTNNQITATPTSGAVKLSLPSTITGLSSVTATSFKGTATKATTATTATNLAGGKKGDLPYQTAAGTTKMLNKGADGQVLTLASGVPTWANASSVSGVSAANGLTELSSTIKLGGTLTAATTINQDGKDMTFTTGTGKLVANGTFKTTGAIYAKPPRVIASSGGINWKKDDVCVFLANGYSGKITFPDATVNEGRLIGINNRSGGVIGIEDTAGGATGIYTNENVIQLAGTVGMVWFISDGTSWRLYSGRP